MAFIFSASWACLHGSAHNIQSHNPQQVGSIQYSFICITRLTMDIVNLHIHCASSMNTHTHIVQLYSRVVCGFLTKRVLHGALSNGETHFCILGFNIEKVTHYEVLKKFFVCREVLYVEYFIPYMLVCLQWSSQACRSSEWTVPVLPSSALDKQPEGKLKSHLIQHIALALHWGRTLFKHRIKTFSQVTLSF